MFNRFLKFQLFINFMLVIGIYCQNVETKYELPRPYEFRFSAYILELNLGIEIRKSQQMYSV